MTEKIISYLFEHAPFWFVAALVFLAATLWYGPKIIGNILKVAEEYRDKSDKFKNEHIAMLRQDKDRMQREINELRAELRGKKNA